MEELTTYNVRTASRKRCKAGALAAGLLSLSLVWNIAQATRINSLETTRMEVSAQLAQAEQSRDRTLAEMEKTVALAEQKQQEPAAQPVAYEAVDAYQYIGECTLTSYCPCKTCCGKWADGLTATGIPAEPGIVAVDPDVIPLGSIVIIDGQRYLAADTGVKGNWIDICAASHQEANDFGIQTAEVWIETEEADHG